MKFHGEECIPTSHHAIDVACRTNSEHDAKVLQVMASMIRIWESELRPYYKCWPQIMDALIKIKLDRTLQEASLSERVILLRFGNGHELIRNNAQILSVLTAALGTGNQGVLWVGACGARSGRFFVSAQIHSAWHGTMEDICQDKSRGPSQHAHNLGYEFWGTVFKIALTCHLLANDPSIIEPDVLNKDEPNYRLSGDEKYVAKAHRRGKVGWHIGRSFEAIPHFRRPHLGLRHTGKGRTVPRIVPIKGCVVHRNKMTRVPTGWLTPDGIEVEPKD